MGTVTILGVGLIGGSIGMALKRRGLARRVVGHGRDSVRLEQARALGAIDEASTNLASAIRESSVVVVCTPVDRIAADVLACVGAAGPDLLITDAGSTKLRIVQALEGRPGVDDRFVGAHPIAGSEKSGVGASRPDLFEGATCVITPTQATPAPLVARARAFWAGLGCLVVNMTPFAHDDLLAQTSHLPHVVAAAIASSTPDTSLGFGGGAFRDMTRVAAADPGIWVSILLENRDAILRSLSTFQATLGQFEELLLNGNPERLAAWWRNANEKRAAFELGRNRVTPEVDQPA